MKVVEGDIWDRRFDCHMRVVPTNIGWRSDGSNVMGRGVARQAAERNPGLAEWYGQRCKYMAMLGKTDEEPFDVWLPGWTDDEYEKIGHGAHDGLIMFPVKPLDKIQPHMSWRQKASLELITASTKKLVHRSPNMDIVLPMVGCGNGQLAPAAVFPILTEYLTTARFTLVLTRSMFAAYKYLGDAA